MSAADLLLVSTAWLNAHLHAPNLRIIDIRGRVMPAGTPLPHYYAHHEDYVKSHIPGAVFVDWVRDITDPASSTGSLIAPPEAYAALMSRLGVGDETHVVAYDDAGGMFAARLWWTLNYYGHGQVSVLDGGWQKWLAEGRPTTADVPDIASAVFTPRANAALRRTLSEVAAQVEAGGGLPLVDVRTPGEFTGQVSRARRAGHIPGAVNLPRGDLLNADGTLRAPEDLRLKLAEAGVTADNAGETVFYCNGGVSASYGLLALRAAGFEGGAVYDGSWKEWGGSDTTPIES